MKNTLRFRLDGGSTSKDFPLTQVSFERFPLECRHHFIIYYHGDKVPPSGNYILNAFFPEAIGSYESEEIGNGFIDISFRDSISLDSYVTQEDSGLVIIPKIVHINPSKFRQPLRLYENADFRKNTVLNLEGEVLKNILFRFRMGIFNRPVDLTPLQFYQLSKL